MEVVTEATGDGLGRGGDGAELKGGVTTFASDSPEFSPPQETHAKVMMEAILVRGHDVGRNVTGRKRHIIADPNGFLVHALVHSASIPETNTKLR